MRLKPVEQVSCAVMIAVLTVTSAACDRKDPNIPKIAAGVKLFNSRFNAGQFNEIYTNADPRFRESVSEQDFTVKLAQLMQKHGAIESSAMNGFDMPTRWQRLFPGTQRTRFIGVYSRCKHEGFQELFTFDVTGEEAKLLRFETNLEDLNRKLRE